MAGDPAITMFEAEAAAPPRPVRMERTPSESIKSETGDLKEAIEEGSNVMLDLNMDGTIRWVTPSWETVVGTPTESILNKPLSEIIVEDDKDLFTTAVETMKNDDARSYRLRFSVLMGPLAKYGPDTGEEEDDGFAGQNHAPPPGTTLSLEGQGILIYDRESGEPSHTMWVLRPFIEPEQDTVDLPAILVDGLGVGAGLLARYLQTVAEKGLVESNPPPLPLLCRICERQIVPWWFEKHSELCLLEHKAESEVQQCQENLSLHRKSICAIIDALESKANRNASGESTGPVEYRGLPVTPVSNPSSGTSTPVSQPTRSREGSLSEHRRSRPFLQRRPQLRIVELLLDLCDTALEIKTPALKPTPGGMHLGHFRTQSPDSAMRITQVMQWNTPASSLDQEAGLSLLYADTEAAAKNKVEAVERHRNTIEYAERLRIEFSMLVQDCIDEAARKALLITADQNMADEEAVVEVASDDEMDAVFPADADERPRRNSDSIIELPTSPLDSPIPTSPEENSATPKTEASSAMARRIKRRPRSLRRSRFLDGDPGAESDSSVHSALMALERQRTESPASERGIDRVVDRENNRKSSGESRKRYSALFNGTQSPRRQPSPSRAAAAAAAGGATAVTSSPMRGPRARLSNMFESFPTPITSPLLTTGDFSPAIDFNNHHRRQSSVASGDLGSLMAGAPRSPRIPAVNPAPPRSAPSIKDFEVIKPISKGAFGSVYLSKKKTTGDYFAIKVLKKSDMIVKNQVTNVRAERAIMMRQGESDFVAKLFWTFASKDYLYLVMEYLNGGDCAALIKSLGGLSEDWSKKYLAEVVLGLEDLHGKGIVHRDLKPDNLLIDHQGHLKLTDFGLSRMGLLGRQKRAQSGPVDPTPDLLKQGFSRSKSISVASSRSASFDLPATQSPANTPLITPEPSYALPMPSYFSLSRENTLSRESSRRTSNPRSEVREARSDSGNSDHLTQIFSNFSLNDPAPFTMVAKKQSEDDTQSNSSSASDLGNGTNGLGLQHVSSNSSANVNMVPTINGTLALFHPDDNTHKFVGTPDYLAPETIKGSVQDEMCDWWSLGCILFEFLYGYPPFHADSPDAVFENILNRRIDWPDDDDYPVSPEAKDLMNKLMCVDVDDRLGANGALEVKSHPFFADINWESLLAEEPSFVPLPQNPEDTDYFDARGATLQSFAEEFEEATSPQRTPGADYPDRPHDAITRSRREPIAGKRTLMPLHIPPHVREGRSRRLSEPVVSDDFGDFTYRNIDVLGKANKDVIQKMRTEELKSGTTVSSSPSSSPSVDSPQFGKPLGRALSTSSKNMRRPVSPSNFGSITSSPARQSQPSSPLLIHSSSLAHPRKTSNESASSSHHSTTSTTSSLAPSIFDSMPRLATSFKPPKASSLSSSPVKTHLKPLPSLQQSVSSPQKLMSRASNPRVRSLTVNSQDGELVIPDHWKSQQPKRRSGVFDMSPSSSDNEDSARNSALLRVQRRRQSSRRMSSISLTEGPLYRPLDILVCDDHPVSRMVMEKLLEKLRCRTMTVDTGSEALRCGMGEVKFDIIFMEFRLPQVNGDDVAKMIRTTRNVNSNTPIVAVTAYIKELQAANHFDKLIEKPVTNSKLVDTMEKLCQWKPPPDDRLLSPPDPRSLLQALRHPHPIVAFTAPSAVLASSVKDDSEPSVPSLISDETDSPVDRLQSSVEWGPEPPKKSILNANLDLGLSKRSPSPKSDAEGVPIVTPFMHTPMPAPIPVGKSLLPPIKNLPPDITPRRASSPLTKSPIMADAIQSTPITSIAPPPIPPRSNERLAVGKRAPKGNYIHTRTKMDGNEADCEFDGEEKEKGIARKKTPSPPSNSPERNTKNLPENIRPIANEVAT